MAIFRNQVVRDFVQIRNALLDDPAMSWKAKGILCYLLSKPAVWKANSTDIEHHASDGITAVRSGLDELETAGYVVRGQDRDEAGKFVGYIFDVYDIPRPEDERSDPRDRKRENPVYGKPDYGINKFWISGYFMSPTAFSCRHYWFTVPQFTYESF